MKILNPNIKLFCKGENYIIYNKVTQKSYKIGSNEYKILKYCSEHCDYKDTEEYKEIRIRQLILNFEAANILMDSDFIDKKPKSIIYRKSLIDFDAESNYENKCKKLSCLLYILLPSLLIIAIFMQGYSKNNMEVLTTSNIPIVLNFVFTLVSFFITTMGHELAHFVVASANGVIVTEIGFKQILTFVYGYTKIIDFNETSLKSRVGLYSAGVVLNSIIALICWILLPIIKNLYLIGFLKILLFTNLFVILVNLIYIVKTDGNKILNVLIGYKDINKNLLNLITLKSRNEKMIDNLVTILFLFKYLFIGLCVLMFVCIHCFAEGL